MTDSSTTSRSETDAPPASIDRLRQQMRGSTLLLLGRGGSLVINLLTQVLVVRYLAKSDYGCLAYALASVELASMAAAFGMDKTFARFGAIYHERGHHPQLLGGFALGAAVSAGLGLVFALVLMLGHRGVTALLGIDAETMTILAIVAALIPVQAISALAVRTFAVFGNTRTILLRKYLFSPLLKLIGVSIVMLSGGSALGIAIAFLVAGLVALLLDAYLLRETFAKAGYRLNSWRELKLPTGEFFGYAIPLLSSDVTQVVRGSLVVLLVGTLATIDAAGELRAILPIVKLNELVVTNAWILFVPLASRLVANEDRRELQSFYIQTSLWVTVLSFPVFAFCICLATPLTTTLFGVSYANAASLLAVLSVGHFIQASLGMSGTTLKVLGHMWPIVAVDLIAASTAIGLCFLWIPDHGAYGAAWATTCGMASHSLLKAGLVFQKGLIGRPSAAVGRTYVLAICLAVTLTLISLSRPLDWFTGLALATSSSLFLIVSSRSVLEVTNIFPETKRFAVLHRWFAST